MKASNALFLRVRTTVLCLALILFPGGAFAQWLGFLRLDGVTGESADTNHVGWMDVVSASAGNLTNSNPAGLPGLPAGPSQGALCFEKKLDAASPTLKLLCAQGTLIRIGALDLTRTNTTLVEFLRLNLANVLISSVSSAGNAQSETRPTEEVCLTAAVESWTYTQFSPASGLPRSYVESAWNFQSNTGSGTTNHPLFVVSGIRKSTGVELTWPATPGKSYLIYAAPRLNGAFTPVSEVAAPAAGGAGTMTNTRPLDSPAMFFVVEQAP